LKCFLPVLLFDVPQHLIALIFPIIFFVLLTIGRSINNFNPNLPFEIPVYTIAGLFLLFTFIFSVLSIIAINLYIWIPAGEKDFYRKRLQGIFKINKGGFFRLHFYLYPLVLISLLMIVFYFYSGFSTIVNPQNAGVVDGFEFVFNVGLLQNIFNAASIFLLKK
jgi:hypothetical protein